MKTPEEIEQLAEKWYNKQGKLSPSIVEKRAFKEGYTQCQQDNSEKKYTIEDMKKACAIGIDIVNKSGENDFQPFEDLINSLK